uniref:Uncharacterized protein n=1 Tax=viral metagenome TaxID=1070528 RepID=A0A6M3LUB7_9ZZZZ
MKYKPPCFGYWNNIVVSCNKCHYLKYCIKESLKRLGDYI